MYECAWCGGWYSHKSAPAAVYEDGLYCPKCAGEDAVEVSEVVN